MPTTINNLELAKSFGVDVDNDKLEKNDVRVPKEALEKIKQRMVLYYKIIKENRHASAKNKLRNVFTSNKDMSPPENKDMPPEESYRREVLKNTIISTRNYVNGAYNFFQGCIDNNKIDSAEKEIIKDANALIKKGYVPQNILTKENQVNQHDKKSFFEKKEFSLDPLKKIDQKARYGEIVSERYNSLYNYFNATLNKYEQFFQETIDDAKKSSQDSIENFEKITKVAEEIFKKYKSKYKTIGELLKKYDTKKDKKLNKQKEELIPKSKQIKDELLQCLRKLKYINMRTISINYFTNIRTVRNLRENLVNYNDYLNEFYKCATSRNCSYKTLEAIHEKLVDYTANTKITQSLDSFVASDPIGAPGDANKITKEIEDMEEKLESIYKNMIEAKQNFDDEVTKFDEQYQEFEKANKAKKMQLGILWALTILSLLNGCMQPILGALTATVKAIPSPVDPMPASL